MGKILVVDDDDSILDAIKLLLEDSDYEVALCKRGEDVIKKINATMPDVILLDYLMSGVNGHDICIKIKNTLGIKNIPVVIITAHPKAKELSVSCGAEDFLIKPFEKQMLINMVKKYVKV